jgi:anti-anti-sigma factor
MDIIQELHGQVLVVAPGGRLDSETSGELELVLHDAETAGRRHFVIDLAAVTYVSSAGLRVLLAQAKRLDGGAGSVRLCSLSPSVRQVFDISGFSSMFTVFPNRAAALDRHPHMLDASGALVAAAAALLGATGDSKPAVDDLRTSTAAELLGAPPPQEELRQRSTMVGASLGAVPPAGSGADKQASGSRWKRLFGKD